MQFSENDYSQETPQSMKVLNWAFATLIIADILWYIL